MGENEHVNSCSSCIDNLDEYKEISEGKAKILFPKANTVFYNNVQVFNRDLSVAIIKKFNQIRQEELKTKRNNHQTKKHVEDQSKSSSIDVPNNNGTDKPLINILEALSATGLRAVRYALEIPNVRIVANDLSKEAVKNITRNIKFNNVDGVVSSSLSDAR